jgi:hypothetical protein
MNAAAPIQKPLPSAYRRQTPTIWQAVGSALWQALHATGQRRAARELRELARRWDDIDPAVARQLREAAGYDTGTETLSIKETP